MSTHIWQHHVALPSVKLMMAVLEDQGQRSFSASHIRSDVRKHFEKSRKRSGALINIS